MTSAGVSGKSGRRARVMEREVENEDGMPEGVRGAFGKQIPFPQRLGKPEGYADTAAFIYSTPMINGETIRVDGAIRMQPR